MTDQGLRIKRRNDGKIRYSMLRHNYDAECGAADRGRSGRAVRIQDNIRSLHVPLEYLTRRVNLIRVELKPLVLHADCLTK
ncbi:hypothetical protein VTG60DRAFT_4562 [Thermothelomyces hinnuleus]